MKRSLKMKQNSGSIILDAVAAIVIMLTGVLALTASVRNLHRSVEHHEELLRQQSRLIGTQLLLPDGSTYHASE